MIFIGYKKNFSSEKRSSYAMKVIPQMENDFHSI